MSAVSNLIPGPSPEGIVNLGNEIAVNAFKEKVKERGVNAVAKEVFEKDKNNFVIVQLANRETEYYKTNDFTQIQKACNSALNLQNPKSSDFVLENLNDEIEHIAQGLLSSLNPSDIKKLKEKVQEILNFLDNAEAPESSKDIALVSELKSECEEIINALDELEPEIELSNAISLARKDAILLDRFESFKPILEKMHAELSKSQPSEQQIETNRKILDDIGTIPDYLKSSLKDINDLIVHLDKSLKELSSRLIESKRKHFFDGLTPVQVEFFKEIDKELKVFKAVSDKNVLEIIISQLTREERENIDLYLKSILPEKYLKDLSSKDSENISNEEHGYLVDVFKANERLFNKECQLEINHLLNEMSISQVTFNSWKQAPLPDQLYGLRILQVLLLGPLYHRQKIDFVDYFVKPLQEKNEMPSLETILRNKENFENIFSQVTEIISDENKKMTELPAFLSLFTNLKEFLFYGDLTAAGKLDFSSCPKLEKLVLVRGLKIAPEVSTNTKLKVLNLSESTFETPPELFKNTNLIRVDFSKNKKLKKLPTIGNQRKLELILRETNITDDQMRRYVVFSPTDIVITIV